MTLTTLVMNGGPTAAFGLVPRDEFCIAVNRSAPTNGDTNPTSESITAGELVIFCITGGARITADGLTPTPYPGTAASLTACVNHKYAASECALGIWGIAVENIAAGAQGRVQLRGRVTANVYHTSNTAVGAGTLLVANASKTGYLDGWATPSTSTAVRRYLGYAIATLSGTTSTGGQIEVVFDGINGIGGFNG